MRSLGFVAFVWLSSRKCFFQFVGIGKMRLLCILDIDKNEGEFSSHQRAIACRRPRFNPE